MAIQLPVIRRVKAGRIRDCLLLGAVVALTRFVFRSRYLYDLDSVNFALALEHFDPELHQPHPPGYYLYVCLGRLAYAVFRDANFALVVVSIAASVAAALAIYALADCWFGRRAAVFSGLAFVLSPLCWFHGTVALTYIVEAFFSALVGYLCWQTWSGRAWFVVPSALALAAATGFRQSSILFLGPLWLLSLRNVRFRQAAAGFAALAAGVAAWLLPMAGECGGLVKYLASFWDLWSRVPAQKTVFSSSFGAAFALLAGRASTIAFIAALCFGLAAPLLFVSRPASSERRRIRVFTWVWVAPALAFFTLIFMQFINSGYLLVASPPLFAWIGSRAADWLGSPRWRGGRRAAALAFAAAAHAAVFLFAPLYCSYRSVRQFESELESAVRSVRETAGPRDTLIVSFDSHFLGYRHAGYYLPEYWTVQYPEVPRPGGRRVFAMRDNHTWLLDNLPVEERPNFVLFPLPDESSFRAYLEGLRARFPQEALRADSASGRELLFGSTADLTVLFPSTAAQASTRLYSPRRPLYTTVDTPAEFSPRSPRK